MAICRSIWSVALINFKRWKNDHRIFLIFLAVGSFLVYELDGLTEYGLLTGGKCTGFLLPVLFTSNIMSVGGMKTMLYLGGILLLCDAPFIYLNTPYVIFRSRRDGWWLGECMYILLTTLIYMAFITVVSTCIVLPVITFGESWGDVVRDMTLGYAGLGGRELALQYGVHVTFPEDSIGYFYPMGAQMYTFLITWASFLVLGLIQYLVSLKSKNVFLGFAAAGVFVFLDPFLNLLSKVYIFRWVQVLSPVCWSSMDSLHLVDGDNFLTIPFIVIMFAVWITFLLLAIRMLSKKIIIETRVEA